MAQASGSGRPFRIGGFLLEVGVVGSQMIANLGVEEESQLAYRALEDCHDLILYQVRYAGPQGAPPEAGIPGVPGELSLS